MDINSPFPDKGKPPKPSISPKLALLWSLLSFLTLYSSAVSSCFIRARVRLAVNLGLAAEASQSDCRSHQKAGSVPACSSCWDRWAGRGRKKMKSIKHGLAASLYRGLGWALGSLMPLGKCPSAVSWPRPELVCVCGIFWDLLRNGALNVFYSLAHSPCCLQQRENVRFLGFWFLTISYINPWSSVFW